LIERTHKLKHFLIVVCILLDQRLHDTVPTRDPETCWLASTAKPLFELR
jgi:hypothetical protein